MIKNLKEFLPKSKLGRSIEGVLVEKDKIVATDSFKLIEIRHNTGAGTPFIATLPPKLKTITKIEKISDTKARVTGKNGEMYETGLLTDPYPDYAKIIPTTDPIATLKVNPVYLASIGEALSADNDSFMGITIEIHGANKPIVFKSKNMTALLMPIQR
jgi:hypothetical protein